MTKLLPIMITTVKVNRFKYFMKCLTLPVLQVLFCSFRGRKSNFIYGSTKSAFTQYLAGLRQYLAARNIIVNVIVAGYIRSKMTAGLHLPESLMLEPAFIARSVVRPDNRFVIVPGFKWKVIYRILKILPENLVAKLP